LQLQSHRLSHSLSLSLSLCSPYRILSDFPLLCSIKICTDHNVVHHRQAQGPIRAALLSQPKLWYDLLLYFFLPLDAC
jgi:hypothetical protein